jgi:hypothetical protein
MTLIGYTVMCEQASPKQLVRDVALVQVGGETQEQFITGAATQLLPALRTS